MMSLSLVDPIQPAVEVWIVIWENLPLAIRSFTNLTLGIFLVVSCFKLFYHLRG